MDAVHGAHALLLLAGLFASDQVVAQDLASRSVPELVAEFNEDPSYSGVLTMALRECPPRPGTWQHEYITELMRLPPRRELDWALTVSFSATIGRCESELISNWLEERLQSGVGDNPYQTIVIASQLGRSGSGENREAALETLFDARLGNSTREEILVQWVRGSATPHSDAINLMAGAYPRFDGVPPQYLQQAATVVREQEGEALGLRALRRLLSAVTERPDADAAIPVMSSLLSATTLLDLDDPWMQEFGAAVEQLVAGSRPAPPELREFLSERLPRFCRGGDAVQRNPACRR